MNWFADLPDGSIERLRQDAQEELEAERFTKTVLLLDAVARGEGTVDVAKELARELGIEWKPLPKRNPVPAWDGTCNPF